MGINNQLKIYDISNISSPVLQYQTNTIKGKDQVYSMSISPDEQTLIVHLISEGKECLLVYDILNLRQLSLISNFYIGQSSRDEFAVKGLMRVPYDPFFIDAHTIAIFYGSNTLIVDISLKTHPFVSGSIYSGAADRVSLTHLPTSSGFPLIFTNRSKLLTTVNLKDQYIVDISNITIGRGDIYSHELAILKKNALERYTLCADGCQFVSASLYDITLAPDSSTQLFPVLPDWISFDKTSAVLKVRPTTQVALKLYSVYFTLSTQVQEKELAAIDKSINPVDLLAELVSYGYLDKNRYLTSDFDPNGQLYLSATYNQNKTRIRSVLADHTFGVLKRIQVISSLTVNSSLAQLSVATASIFPLNLHLQLLSPDNQTTTQCQFVAKSASTAIPTFLKEFTTVTLQGPVYDINNALADLIVNLKDNYTPCDGILTIDDSLNPTFNETISNITNLFYKNRRPQLMQAAQFQQSISNVPLESDTYFSIAIDKTFFNQDGLTFALLSTELVSWLTLTGSTLSGTPPKAKYHVWPKEYHARIRVANQYKWLDVTVILKVKMSLSDWLGLAVQVIGLIGLYVYFTAIVNIIAKRMYVDPQPWTLRAGEQVTPVKLFPIAFIAQELEERKLLLKQLRTYFAKELRLRSISNAKLAMHLIEPRTNQIDVKKLARAIQNVKRGPSGRELDMIEQDHAECSSRRELVQQLILNDLVMIQLNTTKERLTMQVFKRLKDRWRSLIVKDSSYLWQFGVDNIKLYYELDVNGVYAACTQTGGLYKCTAILKTLFFKKNYNRASKSKSKPESSVNYRESTIIKPTVLSKKVEFKDFNKFKGINLDLLRKALIAHAFTKHHVNTKAIDVRIACNQVVDVACVPRVVSQFLKMDLQLLHFNKGNKIDCGIRYKITNNILEFSGITNDDIEDRTLVVQVALLNSKILKEISICGTGEEEEKIQQLIDLNSDGGRKGSEDGLAGIILTEAGNELPPREHDKEGRGQKHHPSTWSHHRAARQRLNMK